MNKPKSLDRATQKRFEKLGLRIRKIRNEKGLTLEDVEDRGYPSWRHLQKIEAGKPFNMTSLFKIADALNIPISELLQNIK